MNAESVDDLGRAHAVAGGETGQTFDAVGSVLTERSSHLSPVPGTGHRAHRMNDYHVLTNRRGRVRGPQRSLWVR